MKFTRLVWVNVFRNKRRTALTLMSVIVAFFLFGTLRSIVTTLDAAAEVGSEARLVASNASGITFVLPEAHASRLQAFDGVSRVSWANCFMARCRSGRGNCRCVSTASTRRQGR